MERDHILISQKPRTGIKDFKTYRRADVDVTFLWQWQGYDQKIEKPTISRIRKSR